MDTNHMNKNEPPTPKWTLGTTAIVCLLAAFAIGATAYQHASNPPAKVVAEAP